MTTLTALEQAAPRTETAGAEIRVMVVEESAYLGMPLKDAIGPCDATVTVSRNASEAIRTAAADDFDYIITDYHLPDMDGLELTRQLRERFPFAVIIGVSNEDMADAFLRVGANDFLKKPLIPGKLAMMIDGGDILAGA